MPFALIPTALGVCFCLVWVFIGGMIFRDGQFASKEDRETEIGILRLPSQRTARRTPATIMRANQSGREPVVRAAS